MDQPSRPRPELLAPAGDRESLRAAVANGADAVYFGLPRFNARHRATNFSLEELPEILSYLHDHNVRGYVAFNTLVFSDELPDAARLIATIAGAGADGVIVQDLGLARLIHRLAPSLPIHGSTQMTLTEPRGIEFVRRLGVERVILARELSIDEIRAIRGRTEMPVEVFVHGALCVAYSGQCLTSESLGGRSANRGQCAQACRLPYEMHVDGHPKDLSDKAYLLSPQDLAAHDLVGDLLKIGVTGFKIEGRLKSARYVAASTQAYRAALDAAIAGAPFALDPGGRTALEQSFSRGLSHGFLDGVDHRKLVHAKYSGNRGIRIGRVAGRTDRGVVIEIERGELKPGDGVVFDEGRPGWDEQGGRVYAVRPAGPARIEAEFGGGAIQLSALPDGCLVWKTDDPALVKRLEHSYSRDRVPRPVPLDIRVTAVLGEPLRIRAGDGGGNSVELASEHPLVRAKKHPATVDLFREQLGRLGGTPFSLGTVGVDRLDPVMVPKSVLNDMRRRAVAELLRSREVATHHPISHSGALDSMRQDLQTGHDPWVQDFVITKSCDDRSTTSSPTRLYVLARTMDQLRAILALTGDQASQPAMAYCDFEDIRRYGDAVAAAHSAGMPIGLATLRIVKPSEEGLLRKIADFRPEALLVRNLAGLVLYREAYPDIPRIGDYAFNVANELTADLLASEGLARLVPSYDLTWPQMAAMLGRIDPGLFEVVLHQHMPMFHMEHCVIAATLSNGKDHRDCGRPCDRHRTDLKDRAGAVHPLVADAGCRNTVFNGMAQSGAEFIPAMLKAGIRHVRVELLRETPEEARDLIATYAGILSGAVEPKAAWKRIRALNQLGVTRGTLE